MISKPILELKPFHKENLETWSITLGLESVQQLENPGNGRGEQKPVDLREVVSKDSKDTYSECFFFFLQWVFLEAGEIVHWAKWFLW